MMHPTRRLALLLAGLLLSCAAVLHAQEQPAEVDAGAALPADRQAPPAASPYAPDPVQKLGRGLTNVLTCWIELPKQTYQGLEEGNPLVGAGRGLVRGLGLAVMRLGIGAYEAVTFPVPIPRRYASPYAGMELPDYAWE